MEDRIAVLESKVAELQSALDDAAMKHWSLKRAFIGLSGPIASAFGISPDQLREGREQCSAAAVWMTFPGVTPETSDRRGDVLSQEFDEIYAGLITEGEAHRKASPPAPLNRYETRAGQSHLCCRPASIGDSTLQARKDSAESYD